MLFLMFSADETYVRREGLFGALFFESVEAGDGGADIALGVSRPAVLGGIFVIFSLLIALSQVIYRWLKGYRSQLIAARA